MSKVVSILEAITERVKLLDRSGAFVKWLEPAEAHGYIRRGEVMLLRTKRKIRGLKMLGDYSGSGAPIEFGSGVRMGEPHRRETYSNPKGVLTFDRIPRSSRKLFTAVVDGCLRTAA